MIDLTQLFDNYRARAESIMKEGPRGLKDGHSKDLGVSVNNAVQISEQYRLSSL